MAPQQRLFDILKNYSREAARAMDAMTAARLNEYYKSIKHRNMSVDGREYARLGTRIAELDNPVACKARQVVRQTIGTPTGAFFL